MTDPQIFSNRIITRTPSDQESNQQKCIFQIEHLILFLNHLEYEHSKHNRKFLNEINLIFYLTKLLLELWNAHQQLEIY